MNQLTIEQAWDILRNVKDPEIPVVSVVEMGIVRKIEVQDGNVQVTMTPTFTGCPALQVMHDEIIAALKDAGAPEVLVTISHNPPWSSDWIKPEARQRLKEFGLAPPPMHGGFISLDIVNTSACPYCDSENTTLKNSFGPTLCRAIYYCNDCQQPFEQFKPL
jgi:ring-1,2-phenylacetyl-CoA epoxidase subunit PaaD